MNLIIFILVTLGAAGQEIVLPIRFDQIRASNPQESHHPLSPRSTCQTTCSNGGCCNTGGPCTTDGMCCSAGETPCSDGGCCPAGSTCATENGAQICKSYTNCVAPPVTCGIACCDAGMTCVSFDNQFRCERNSSEKAKTTPSVSAPELGDSLRSTTVTASVNTGSVNTKPVNVESADSSGGATTSPSMPVKETSAGTSMLKLWSAMSTLPIVILGLVVLLVQ